MKELIQTLRSVAGKAQFASFVYTSVEKLDRNLAIVDGGEVARYNLLIGINYNNVLEKSLIEVKLLNRIELIGISCGKGIPFPVMKHAQKEVIKSLEKSISSRLKGEQNPDYTKKGLYIPLGGGLNLNSNDLTLQMFGLVQSKVVLKEGVHAVVNSAPVTVAKNLIRKNLSIGKWREFALDLGNIHTVKLNGQILEIE